ncbi:hypothetical protein [Luteitalea sp. TBR-22]|uniref:hypothetical protein n=1 Tax=Luteitalea sp. TBR-22 TaxID=2802971 RepID=UPI001EF6DB91|nr:hypothetical protein [Luteitalea sp. TBR-22]
MPVGPRPPNSGAHGLGLAAILAAVAALGATGLAQERPKVLVTSPTQRQAYLATAILWEDRELPSPARIVEGRGTPASGGRADLNPPGGLPCTWESGGAQMGGNTPKFTCRTANRRLLRVKYYDGQPRTGNREVFAEVVAVRLFWALGFPSDIVLPLTVQCLECPENPMAGTGPRATRTFLGVTEPAFRGTPILSSANADQGWQFGELDAAITALPPGADRDRQRIHFDALSLLGAFVQHGDRKPAQQRLVCAEALDLSAGDVHPLDARPLGVAALFEHPGARACRAPLAMIQDLGATFGSSGKGTIRTGKIDLGRWAMRPVFLPPAEDPDRNVRGCRADVTPALDAGPGARANPRIGEAGRRFLVERLQRLTDDHLRALFTAARVEALGEPLAWTAPGTRKSYTGLDAWVEAFKYKREQLALVRCGQG